jgi:hypothetical protein
MSPKYILTPLAVFAFSLTAFAQEKSEVQSAARPYDLDIIGPVMVAGSDEASKQFQYETLPGLLNLTESTFSESQEYLTVAEMEAAKKAAAEGGADAEAKAASDEKKGYEVKSDIKSEKGAAAIYLNPSMLILSSDVLARAYFISEGAGYHNTLGMSTTGGSPFSKDAALIFPDASAPDGKPIRSESEPLLAGDFVDLGVLKKGSILDFFLIANGAEKPYGFYSTERSLNEDGLTHAVAMAFDGSPYLLIGFEDLYNGGDKDYNDLVFAIDIGVENIKYLASLGAPEPSMAAGAMLAGVAFFGLNRRRRA